MGPVQAGSQTKTITDFCKEVVFRHKDSWPPSESALAHEFVEQYRFELFSDLERIAQFSETLGIQTSVASLPDRIYGLNCSVDGKNRILLSESEVLPGAREHTFLHELREILEYIFRDLGFPTVEAPILEEHADEFACQVRIVESFRLLEFFVDSAHKMEARWKRWLSYAGIMVLALAFSIHCLFLPHLENRLSPVR